MFVSPSISAQLLASSLSERFVDFTVHVMERLGGPGAALLIALENLFPPLPSEIVLPLAGFTASQGNISLPGAVIWTTLGSLVGALALYYIGAWLGRDRIRTLARKLPLVRVADIDRTEKWFMTHENQTVFWGRMVPVVRSLISIPAGIERMPLQRFVLFTTAGSMIWNSGLILAGFLLGEQWHLVEAYVEIMQYIVIAIAAVWLAHFIFQRTKKRRQRKSTPKP